MNSLSYRRGKDRFSNQRGKLRHLFLHVSLQSDVRKSYQRVRRSVQ